MSIVKQTVGLSGRYKIEAVHAETGERRIVADWFDNLITDEGLNQIGTGPVGDMCVVGSGSAAPTVNDIGLVSLVASTTTVMGSTNTANLVTLPYYIASVQTFRFAQGVAAGNLSEVGMRRSGSGGNGWIFSRALIKDSGGSPTTITVTASEFLDVSYELRLYPSTADFTFNVTISGVTHSCVGRASGLSSGNAAWVPSIILGYGIGWYSSAGAIVYSGGIGAITGSPSGTNGSATGSVQAYSNNSLKRTATSSFTLGTGNFVGGVQSVLFYIFSGGQYQVEFTPTIAKDETKILSLTYEVSWARRP